MAQGNVDLRKASIILLNEYREKIEMKQRVINSARNDPKVEEWIVVSWELEKQLFEDAVETIKKWIIDDNYNY